MTNNLRPGQSIGQSRRTPIVVDTKTVYTAGTRYSPGLVMTVPVRRTDRHGTDWRIGTTGDGPFVTQSGDVPSDFGTMADYVRNQEYGRGIGFGTVGYGRPRSGRK